MLKILGKGEEGARCHAVPCSRPRSRRRCAKAGFLPSQGPADKAPGHRLGAPVAWKAHLLPLGRKYLGVIKKGLFYLPVSSLELPWFLRTLRTGGWQAEWAMPKNHRDP